MKLVSTHEDDIQGGYHCPMQLHHAVDVRIVPSTEKPSGCGEPPVPVISPAVVNALAQLTGKRYHSLPLAAI